MKHKPTIMERRAFERHATNVPAIIVREGGLASLKPGEFDGRIIDVSRGGLRFTSKELFHRGEQVQVIYPGNDEHPGLRVQVKIVRSDRVPGQKYQMAAKIIELLPAQRKFGPTQ